MLALNRLVHVSSKENCPKRHYILAVAFARKCDCSFFMAWSLTHEFKRVPNAVESSLKTRPQQLYIFGDRINGRTDGPPLWGNDAARKLVWYSLFAVDVVWHLPSSQPNLTTIQRASVVALSLTYDQNWLQISLLRDSTARLRLHVAFCKIGWIGGKWMPVLLNLFPSSTPNGWPEGTRFKQPCQLSMSTNISIRETLYSPSNSAHDSQAWNHWRFKSRIFAEFEY